MQEVLEQSLARGRINSPQVKGLHLASPPVLVYRQFIDFMVHDT